MDTEVKTTPTTRTDLDMAIIKALGRSLSTIDTLVMLIKGNFSRADIVMGVKDLESRRVLTKTSKNRQVSYTVSKLEHTRAREAERSLKRALEPTVDEISEVVGAVVAGLEVPFSLKELASLAEVKAVFAKVADAKEFTTRRGGTGVNRGRRIYFLRKVLFEMGFTENNDTVQKRVGF